MKKTSGRVFLVTVIIVLMSASGIYASVSSSSPFGASTPNDISNSSIVSVVAANDIASSISNLMEKLGKTIDPTVLSEKIIFDGNYVTGSALFNSLYGLGDSFYWTVAFNTSNPNGSSINFLFPRSFSNGSQPEENYFQISFPLYSESSNQAPETVFTYTNFSAPGGFESNTSTGKYYWAGYQFWNNITTPRTINYVEATFNVPKLSYPPSSQNNTNLDKKFGEWIGLSNRFGGVNGLLQSGVGQDSTTIPKEYYLWWEDYNSTTNSGPPYIYNNTSYASPGNLLQVQVQNFLDNGYPYAVQFEIYDRNTSMDYVNQEPYSVTTHYAPFVVESFAENKFGEITAQPPEFSPSANFEGGICGLGNNYTLAAYQYGITTLYNDSYFNKDVMEWDSSQGDNMNTAYTMKWYTFGDVDEYGYPTITWENSYT